MSGNGGNGRLVLFDLDATLFDHQGSLAAGMANLQRSYSMLGAFDLQQLIDTYNAALERAFEQYMRGEVTLTERDRIKMRYFLADMGLPELEDAGIDELQATYRTVYRASQRPVAGSVEALAALKTLGYRIGVLTNGETSKQEAKVRNIGAWELVERVVASSEVGCGKPDRRAFDYMLAAMGATASGTVMVGDSWEKDVLGALGVGMAALWFEPAYEEGAEEVKVVDGREVVVVRSMGELVGRLEAMAWLSERDVR